MENFIIFNLVVLWFLVIGMFILLLRVIRYLRHGFDADAAQAKAPELAIGEPAPDFEVHTLEGKQVNLAHFAGQAVVFVFMSPGCAFCDLVLPKLARLKPIAQARAGVSIILVSETKPDETRKWLAKQEPKIGLPVDWDVLITARYSPFRIAYNPRGLHPYYVMINQQGLVQTHGDPQGDDTWLELERIWEGQTHGIKQLAQYYR